MESAAGEDGLVGHLAEVFDHDAVTFPGETRCDFFAGRDRHVPVEHDLRCKLTEHIRVTDEGDQGVDPELRVFSLQHRVQTVFRLNEQCRHLFHGVRFGDCHQVDGSHEGCRSHDGHARDVGTGFTGVADHDADLGVVLDPSSPQMPLQPVGGDGADQGDSLGAGEDEVEDVVVTTHGQFLFVVRVNRVSE